MEWSLRQTIVLGVWAWTLGWAYGAAAQSTPLSVDDCVRLAVARSPAAQAASFDVDAALARLRAARAAYVPRLSLQGEYGRAAGFDDAVTNGGSTAALLTVETSLLDGGLRNAQFGAARARLRSAKALEQQRRADVAFAVRAAYFSAVAANAEATIQNRTLTTLGEYGSLLQRQERVGLVTSNDILRARLAADNAAAAQRAAAAERDAAQSEITILAGVEISAASLVEPTAGPFTTPDTTAIEASPALVDAQAAVDAARKETDAVRSERRSHLQVTASAGALGVIPDRTFRDNGGGQFLFGFALPLYDGGATAARVVAADAAANSAEASLHEARRTITTALARTGVEGRRAEVDIAAWKTTVPRAAENFELMRARYFGGGNVRLLEVLDALTQYVDAQLAVERAVFAYHVAVAKQQQLVGEVAP